jgi:hypothetical protein
MLAYSHILNQGAFTKYTEIAKKTDRHYHSGQGVENGSNKLFSGRRKYFVVLHTTHVISYWQQKQSVNNDIGFLLV